MTENGQTAMRTDEEFEAELGAVIDDLIDGAPWRNSGRTSVPRRAICSGLATWSRRGVDPEVQDVGLRRLARGGQLGDERGRVVPADEAVVAPVLLGGLPAKPAELSARAP